MEAPGESENSGMKVSVTEVDGTFFAWAHDNGREVACRDGQTRNVALTNLRNALGADADRHHKEISRLGAGMAACNAALDLDGAGNGHE